MSRIDDLIAEHCPDGVEFRELQEIFTTKGGYTPSKTDASAWADGTVPWFRMEDIRENGRVLSHSLQTINERAVKGGRLFPANSLLVATSATIGEHALITVPHLSNQRFTSLALKPEFVDRFDINFVHQYCFVLDAWCCNNTTTSSFASVDMAGFKRFRFPIPPLTIQREIASILDKMESLKAELESELESELELRSHQYAHYRDELLTFGAESAVERVPMGELGTIFGGLTGKSKADFANGSARYVSYVNVFNNIAVDVERDDYVRVGPAEHQRSLQIGDVVFTGSSESAADVAMSSVVTRVPDGPLYLNSFCIGFRPAESEVLLPDFTKHLFRSGPMRAALVRTASGVTRFNVSKARLAKIEVPIPPVDEQRRIASILDKLDTLVTDLSIGLPAEIEARRKQYEFYRDKLLTFEEAA